MSELKGKTQEEDKSEAQVVIPKIQIDTTFNTDDMNKYFTNSDSCTLNLKVGHARNLPILKSKLYEFKTLIESQLITITTEDQLVQIPLKSKSQFLLAHKTDPFKIYLYVNGLEKYFTEVDLFLMSIGGKNVRGYYHLLDEDRQIVG